MPVVNHAKSRDRKRLRAVTKNKKAVAKVLAVPSFKVDDNGIFARSRTGGWEQISSRIDVVAQTRDAAGENWGRRLRWRDSEDTLHEWTVPMELLIGDPAKVRAYLVRNGLPYLSSNPRHRSQFTEFIVSSAVEQRIRSVSKVGWTGKTFVLPDRAISPDGQEETLYQRATNVAYWETKGSLEEWRENVGRMCSQNSRLVFAASCAFAGPLLALVDAESGGFHINGLTSSGKTTALLVAGSILGGGGPNGFLQTWRATRNALEVVAESHHDATLILDELSQVDPREAVDAAYLLGNGFGKARLNRELITREAFRWRLLFLSAGEITLATHASTVGRRTRGGADIRLINLDADAGEQLGLFEELHAFPSPDEFARALQRNALLYYGVPFREFVGTLVAKRESTRRILVNFLEAFRRCYLPPHASGEVRRAADRFALVAVAGELATRWGITGWNRREALLAARRCFREWSAKHGKSGSADLEAAIGRIQHLVERGESRFTILGTDSRSEIEIADRVGFIRAGRRAEEKEFLILPRVFQELCDGISPQAVAGELQRRGHLRRTASHFTLKERIPGFTNPVRLFCVCESILCERIDC